MDIPIKTFTTNIFVKLELESNAEEILIADHLHPPHVIFKLVVVRTLREQRYGRRHLEKAVTNEF